MFVNESFVRIIRVFHYRHWQFRVVLFAFSIDFNFVLPGDLGEFRKMTHAGISIGNSQGTFLNSIFNWEAPNHTKISHFNFRRCPEHLVLELLQFGLVVHELFLSDVTLPVMELPFPHEVLGAFLLKLYEFHF